MTPGIIDRHGRLRNLSPAGRDLRALLASPEGKDIVYAAFGPPVRGLDGRNPYRDGACTIAAEAIRLWIRRTRPERRPAIARFHTRLAHQVDFHDACRDGGLVIDCHGAFAVDTLAEAIVSHYNNAGETCEIRTVEKIDLRRAPKSRRFRSDAARALSLLIEKTVGPYRPGPDRETASRSTPKGPAR